MFPWQRIRPASRGLNENGSAASIAGCGGTQPAYNSFYKVHVRPRLERTVPSFWISAHGQAADFHRVGLQVVRPKCDCAQWSVRPRGWSVRLDTTSVQAYNAAALVDVSHQLRDVTAE